MNLIMYHQIQSQYIKHYITVHTFYKKMFKLLIKYTPYQKEPYSEHAAKTLIECFGRKEFGDKVYEEKFTPIFNKENKDGKIVQKRVDKNGVVSEKILDKDKEADKEEEKTLDNKKKKY